ncbi:uncharacterized protein LOC135843371 [Planococcus citri]|uniref:uncharacterized protein LOC135843371 n=1 Tax=Planococcus citri TaxID=170843 RepID=UPI0031F8A019
MQPQPLVPPEHFVFRIWKKTTNHIINTAPLLENLVPLMSAINIGLKKAQMKLYILNPTSSYVRLRFYTRVTSLSLPPLIDENPSFEQLLQPSIWHKFIYHEVEKKGLLIYIHNTLEEPSTDQRKCEDVVQCEFDRWSNDFPTTVLIQENLQNFAYCCSVTSEHIKEIFFIDVEIKGTLDLNGLISKGRKRQRRNISDMFPNQKITQIAEGSKSKQESTMKTKSRGRPRKHIKEEKISESSSKNVPVKDSKHLEKSKRNKTRDTRSKSNTRNISEIPAEDETVKGSKNKEGSRRNKVRDKKSRHRKISELFSDDVVAVGDPDN